jgi:2-polyprenyl-3-methyl-5-hydroxy-6-metoxy-1,4-benzoquinol methylase
MSEGEASQYDGWPDITAAYDEVAGDYARLFAAELAGKPFDRELLDGFAGAVGGRGPVWDLGCGSAGHITRYLADRGVEVVGADVSPGVVAVARERQPGLAVDWQQEREPYPAEHPTQRLYIWARHAA